MLPLPFKTVMVYPADGQMSTTSRKPGGKAPEPGPQLASVPSLFNANM
jgi:hypothetical protein